MVKHYACHICGHKWIPRTENKPLVCPRCKSYKWSVPSERAEEVAVIETINRNDNLNITDSTRRGGTEAADQGRNDNLNEDMRSDDITPTNDRNNRNNNLNTR